MPLKIIISFTSTERRIPLECEPDLTVSELKKKIFELAVGREIVAPENQHLVFNGTTIEDKSTLEEKRVKSEDLIYVVKRYAMPESELREQGKFYITLSFPCGDIKQYDLPQTATIDDLKAKIQEEDGLLHQEQRLMYKGRQVHVGFLSNFANLRYEIEFNLRIKCVISLRLQASSGEKYVYNIPDTAMIYKVKEAIAKHEGFTRNFSFVFAGQILDNNLTLGDYEVVETQIGFIAFPPEEYKNRRYYIKKSDVFLVKDNRTSLYHRGGYDEQDLKTPGKRRSLLRHLFSCCLAN